MESKGFVTIATGNIHYFKLAVNLLHSYRMHCKNPLPFAIIADKENEYTKEFDMVLIVENPTCSYMDKITMLSMPPFDKNIFIDSDCLAYRDLNVLFDEYDESGVHCFGTALPLESKEGWFEFSNIGKYKKDVSFCINMHGGIMFFANDDLTRNIYTTCLDIADHYSDYKFKMFAKPADEPIVALAMAVNGCKPYNSKGYDGANKYVFLPVARKIKADIEKGALSYELKGQIGSVDNVMLLHFQNVNTYKPLYIREVAFLSRGGKFVVKCKYFIGMICSKINDVKYALNTKLFSLIHKIR